MPVIKKIVKTVAFSNKETDKRNRQLIAGNGMNVS